MITSIVLLLNRISVLNLGEWIYNSSDPFDSYHLISWEIWLEPALKKPDTVYNKAV